MDHPYKSAPDRAFWKRAFTPDWATSGLADGPPLIRRGEKVASAGSCFAANIIPFLERAGFDYVRGEPVPAVFSGITAENFNYWRFSAAYGNIYTARQSAQMIRRALGTFKPLEDRWHVADDLVIDPFRPGLRYAAASDREFDLVTRQHLESVLNALRAADVFLFTLGLTEAWISARDGAVFPACPGTIAGTFDPDLHRFQNFSVRDVTQDIEDLVSLVREVHPQIRIILTVSPVPLVATATGQHVLLATTYSKSVLRAAAGDVAQRLPGVTYFPAYEIVTGPQAPSDFFEGDRREPSAVAIETVMRAFLAQCETDCSLDAADRSTPEPDSTSAKSGSGPGGTSEQIAGLSALIVDAQCEEAAAGQ
jgi:hypothetical protein